MRSIRALVLLVAILVLAGCLSACSFFGGSDYLKDITTDTHSGCFSESTNYLGFTHNATYVHLGDNGAAVNASPSCSGITGAPKAPDQVTIPTNPTLVK